MKFEIAPKSTELRLTWDEASLYCFSLGIDGNVGWRLPTKGELNEIYNTDSDGYWTTNELNDYSAWTKHFISGLQSPCYTLNLGCWVRAVTSTM